LAYQQTSAAAGDVVGITAGCGIVAAWPHWLGLAKACYRDKSHPAAALNLSAFGGTAAWRPIA